MANILQIEGFKPEELVYPAQLIQNINEVMHEAIIGGGPIDRFHTVMGGVKGKTQIGWFGEMGLVGVARQGCDPDRGTAGIPTDTKWLDPQRWEASFTQCYNELLETIALYAMKLKSDEPDLSDTAYWNMVQDKFTTSLAKMIWRIVWFGDTTAKNVADGGVITDGTPIKYFTWLDGFWKKYFALATAQPKRRVVIEANNAVNQTAADAALTNAIVESICNQLKYKADVRLRSTTLINSGVEGAPTDELFVMCTRMFADKVEQMILSKPGYTESQYKIAENGLSYIRFNGLDYYPIDIWDEIITGYQKKDIEGGEVKYNLPYRAILTRKSNQVIATPSTDVFAGVNVWYDKTSRKNYMEAMDALAVEFGRDYLLEVAY